MLHNVEIELIGLTHTTNELGDPVDTETRRSVLADRQSIRQREFYQAQATGLRPEIMFIVRAAEYHGESRLAHAGKEYRIIRTYEREDEMIELVCQGLVNQP